MNENEPETTNPAPEKGGVYSPPEIQLDALAPPPETPVEEKREDARLAFTIILLLIFGFQLIIGAIALFVGPDTWSNAQDYLRVTLPATLGVLGSAIGFYFGSQR